MTKRIKAAFLDRDGTINVEKGYLKGPSEVELIPNADKAIRTFNDAGYVVFGVSNQSGVARGYFSEADVRITNERLLEMLGRENAKVVEILYCPHHPNGTVPKYSIRCGCRKPATGMVTEALARYGFELEEAVVIGDKICDVELGKNLGARTGLVATGFGTEEHAKLVASAGPIPDVFSNDLWEAACALIRPA